MSDFASIHIKCFNPSEEGKSSQSRQRIFHYTSPQGLYSILKNKTIRFTDCQFLNDKSEYNHIREPLKTALEETYYSLHDPSVWEMLNNYISDNFEWETMVNISPSPSKGVNNLKFKTYRMRYYVFCATDLADSLGMWNYYVKGGNYQGYNLQISVNDFLDCFATITNPRIDVFYGKVIYNEKEKVEILKNIILTIDAKLHNDLLNVQQDEDYDVANQEAQGELLTYLENFRLFFKDNSFSAEREYRFVIRVPLEYENEDVLKTGYEMKSGIIVPFCELSIEKHNTIGGITLSPMLEKELAENGLNRFLKDNGYGDKIKPKQSKIPIRY
ncbi:MAG: DUF2971 domain-containing protein [Erysipelotrichaceae bacterium]|nr:DUF2971 domain-containing protein [Erysipelotrichaceae bacterium]